MFLKRTIRTRVRRLEEDGIIRGYTIRGTDRINGTHLNESWTRVEIRSLGGEFLNWKVSNLSRNQW